MARSVTVIPARSQKVRTGHKAVQEKKIRVASIRKPAINRICTGHPVFLCQFGIFFIASPCTSLRIPDRN